MSSANSRPRPSRLNESDSPSDGAQESSISRLPALSVERSSADRTTASIAGQAARIRAAPGERLTSHADEQRDSERREDEERDHWLMLLRVNLG